MSMKLIGHAQEFHAAALWDAFGPVKELKYKTKDPMVQTKKMKFTQDGKLSGSIMVYADNGYPFGMDMNMFGKFVSISFRYKDGLPSNINYSSNVGGWGCFTVTFNYDDKTMVSETVKATDRKSNELLKEYNYNFSNYIKDENGNWISRDVTLDINDVKKGKTEQMNYVETREIKYY